MSMIIKTAAAALAALLLTACGDPASDTAGSSAETPSQSVAESTAETAAETDAASAETAAASAVADQWVFGTANFNNNLTSEEAQALIECMTAGASAPVGDTGFAMRNFNLYNMSGDSPFYQMLLTKDGSWVVTNSTEMWTLSPEQCSDLCHRYYQAMEPQAQMFAEAYDGTPFTLEGMDIPAGSCWLSVRITGPGTCAGIKEYSLKDSAGNAVGVVPIAADTPSEGTDAYLYAVADASQMQPGSYTLTLGDVSTQFSVVEPSVYVQNSAG